MTLTPATVKSASLYLSERTTEKEYHAAIEPKSGGYIVTFAYGRRGSNLIIGSKTPRPLSLDAATRIFDTLVAFKLAKGYHLSFPDYPCFERQLCLQH